MKAMILAAGLGKRMRPLTEHTPKPLLKVGEKHLIEYHLEKLAKVGIREVVINTHWLAQQIPASLGNGDKWGLRLHYSHEPELLETAGGIVQALPMLTSDQEPEFLLINGDVYSEIDLEAFMQKAPRLENEQDAHLALIENPSHNLQGDFILGPEGELMNEGSEGKALTYSGIALFHRRFFQDQKPGPSLLGPLLREAIKSRRVSGEHVDDYWLDVGTPERLEDLRSHLAEMDRQKTDAPVG